jgi:hypothetical protein
VERWLPIREIYMGNGKFAAHSGSNRPIGLRCRRFGASAVFFPFLNLTLWIFTFRRCFGEQIEPGRGEPADVRGRRYLGAV